MTVSKLRACSPSRSRRRDRSDRCVRLLPARPARRNLGRRDCGGDEAKEAEDALAVDDLERAKAAAALADHSCGSRSCPGRMGPWVEDKRREYADVRGRALTVLADASLRSGAAPDAAKWAEQTIALEPFRETGYRRLMEAHIAAGNRAEALEVYERCRHLLAEELGTYPSPETESVYRGLLEAPARRGGDTSGRADAVRAVPRPTQQARARTGFEAWRRRGRSGAVADPHRDTMRCDATDVRLRSLRTPLD